jgi:hypothetical protein
VVVGRMYESKRVCLRVSRRLLDNAEVQVEVDVSVGIGNEDKLRLQLSRIYSLRDSKANRNKRHFSRRGHAAGRAAGCL